MGAMSDRVIAAAELLNMSTATLLDLIDPPHRPEVPTVSINPDDLLVRIRRDLATYGDILDNPGDDPVAELLSVVRELDAHLSSGGRPPEAWREGPDAHPARDDDYTPEAMDRDAGADRLSDEAARLQANEGVTERVEQMYADARALRAANDD